MASEDTSVDNLGAGTFGKATGKLKSIDISTASDQEKNAKKTEWEEEVETLMAVCGHDNIVEYKNSFATDDGMLCFEMEFCNGGTLNDYVIEKDPGNDIKHRFMVEISAGVAFLHEHDVVHYDLKPENIMICLDDDHQPHAKVGDFGLAKIAFCNYEGQLLQYYLSTGCGTEYFMAPEVYDGTYTEKADIFSMGITFLALVTAPITRKFKNKDYLIFYDGTHGMVGKHFHDTKHEFIYYRAFEGMFEESVLKLLDSMIQYHYLARPSAEQVNTTLKSISLKE